MFKFIWYIISVITILLILFNNPTNANNVGSTNRLLSFRANQKGITQLTVVSICLFFILTIFLTKG